MTRRHDSLLPLTHDHHHVLARVRRLKEAIGEGDEAGLWRAAQEFVDFFQDEGDLHFREEEEQLIPLFGDTLPAEAVTMLEDHVILRDLIRGLTHEANVAHVEPETAQRVADRFAAHVRFEEKVLFPMIERIASEEQLSEITLAERDRTSASS